MNLLEVTMKCDRLVVFIFHDSAKIWGFRYGLTLGTGILKIMASTGVFVRVVFARKCSISGFSRTQSVNLTNLTHRKSQSLQKMGPERDLYEGRKRTEETEQQPRIVVNLMNTASKLGPTHKRTEGRAPMWGSEFTSKDAALQRGVIVMLMPLFAAALVVRRRYFIVAPRPFPAAPLVVRRRWLIVVPMPMPEAPRMYLIVV
jgi:hypothetical protein